LAVIRTGHLIESVSRLGKAAMRRPEEMKKEQYEIVGDVEGSGLLVDPEMARSETTNGHALQECLDIPIGESAIFQVNRSVS
jgi:4-aminobutyrate aminotransferase-like enzyme